MKVYEATVDEMDGKASDVKVVLIPAALAKGYWDNVAVYARRALEFAFDGMTVETVLERIVDGRLILVVVTVNGSIVASMTVEICELPRGRIAHCMTLGGDDLEAWVDEFVYTWKAIGEALNCDYVTIKGRAGWERYAKKYGFKHMYTNMYLEIGGKK